MAVRLRSPLGRLAGVLLSKPLAHGFIPVGAVFAAILLLAGPKPFGFLAVGLLVLAILIYPILGLTVLLFIAPIYVLLERLVPKGLPVSFLLLALTLAGLALRRTYETRTRPFRWTFIDGIAAFILINGLFYIPMAANLKAGVYAYHEMFRLFLIYFVVRLLAPGEAAWRTSLSILLGVAFLFVAYGCVQPFWNYDYIMVKYDLAESMKDYAGFNTFGIRRAYSVANPLALGYMGMMGVIVAVGLWSGPRRRALQSSLIFLLLVASAGASAFSFTRSSWIGIVTALVMALVFLFRGRRRFLFLLVPGVLVGAAALFVPQVARVVGLYSLTIFSRDPAMTSSHYVALSQAWDHAWRHLLGQGLGAATFAGFKYGKGVAIWSENTFLQLSIQTGFQSMIALALFVLAAAWQGARLFHERDASPDGRRIGGIVHMGFPAFALSGMSIPTILDVSTFGPLWLMAALVINMREAAAEGDDEPR